MWKEKKEKRSFKNKKMKKTEKKGRTRKQSVRDEVEEEGERKIILKLKACKQQSNTISADNWEAVLLDNDLKGEVSRDQLHLCSLYWWISQKDHSGFPITPYRGNSKQTFRPAQVITPFHLPHTQDNYNDLKGRLRGLSVLTQNSSCYRSDQSFSRLRLFATP